MKKTLLLKLGLLAAGTSLLLAGCVVRERTVYRQAPPPGPAPGVAVETPGAEVDVTGPPPPDVVESVTVSPGPGFIWVGGFYEWGPRGWGWHRGYWGRPPHPGMRWYGPRYAYRGGRHVWVRGGWR
jgi:hypothetical protein